MLLLYFCPSKCQTFSFPYFSLFRVKKTKKTTFELKPLDFFFALCRFELWLFSTMSFQFFITLARNEFIVFIFAHYLSIKYDGVTNTFVRYQRCHYSTAVVVSHFSSTQTSVWTRQVSVELPPENISKSSHSHFLELSPPKNQKQKCYRRNVFSFRRRSIILLFWHCDFFFELIVAQISFQVEFFVLEHKQPAKQWEKMKFPNLVLIFLLLHSLCQQLIKQVFVHICNVFFGILCDCICAHEIEFRLKYFSNPVQITIDTYTLHIHERIASTGNPY